MEDVIVDLETLGTAPGSVILSIGAVAFGPEGLGAEFYTVISVKDSMAQGLSVDADTFSWWLRQGEEARKVLVAATEPTAPRLGPALHEFNAYLRRFKNVKLWGNGSDFDNVLLIAAYQAPAIVPAWEFYNHRCYRTLKNLGKNSAMKLERVGTHHHALDDTKSQALHAIQLLKALNV